MGASDIDTVGRKHRRLARAAYVHELRAIKEGDEKSADAWSKTFCRHTREVLLLTQLKRLILLDIYKLGYGLAYKTEAPGLAAFP